MSSTPYVTELQPDRRARQLVLATGSLLYVTGLLILLGMPVSGFGIMPLLCAWFWQGWREWRSQLGGYRLVSGIRVAADGSIEGIDAAGERRRLRLRGGSFVLANIAWMRLEFPDKRSYAELLFGHRNNPVAWHWLRLVWRQRGSSFGRAQ